MEFRRPDLDLILREFTDAIRQQDCIDETLVLGLFPRLFLFPRLGHDDSFRSSRRLRALEQLYLWNHRGRNPRLVASQPEDLRLTS